MRNSRVLGVETDLNLGLAEIASIALQTLEISVATERKRSRRDNRVVITGRSPRFDVFLAA